MKVSIGTNIKEGPWGGGNLFAINLKNYLEQRGHIVISNLDDDDIDIILLTEPRKTSESSAYTHIDVWYYKKFIKKDVLVVHRFNECDERKNTKFVNKYLLEANKVADHSIFVSEWLRNLFLDQGEVSKSNEVILAGADNEIFNNDNYKIWNENDTLKITTHHWGANWNKGFDIYKKIDEMLDDEYWKNKIEFTYIGNIPKNIDFKNTNLIQPLSGKELADEIKKNHIYVTASRNEPSGNHHIEAAQCGLPILYIDSGGIPEYCQGYGVSFVEENFEIKLKEIIRDYSKYQSNINSYHFSSEKMCLDYLGMFETLITKKMDIVNSRTNTYPINKFLKFLFLYKRKLKKNSVKS